MPDFLKRVKNRISGTHHPSRSKSGTAQAGQQTAAASALILQKNSIQHPQPSSTKPASTSGTQLTLPVRTSVTSGGQKIDPPDLWTPALNKLSPDTQKALSDAFVSLPANTPIVDAVDQLKSLVEQKREQCDQESLKFEFCGKQIILRDVADKAVVWLNKFKEVGDIIVNYNPVHLALPWAGLRFLLQCAIHNTEQKAMMLISMERTAYLMSRCKLYEVLHLSGHSLDAAQEDLKTTLIELYSNILQLLADIHAYFMTNRISRTISAIFSPESINDFLTKSQSLETRAFMDASICERIDRRHKDADLDMKLDQLKVILREIDEPVIRTDLRVAALWDRSNQSIMSEVLSWVSSIPYEDNHKRAREGYVHDTGLWLLKNDKFIEWRNSSASTILWLYGIPGAGKTKLVTTVIENISRALNSQSNDEALAYFYCDRNEKDRRDPLVILQSFVKQLAMSRDGNVIQRSLLEIYQNKKKSGFASQHLDLKDCRDLLQQYTNIYPQTTIVLDALDECNPRTRGSLITIFDDIVKDAKRPVKLFISSRPDDDIRFRFETGPNIGVLATDNQNDIEKLVTERLDEFDTNRREKLSLGLRKVIIDTLLSQSHGMFQWVHLQLAQLLELHIEDDMRARLGKLPKDLKRAYDELYDIIQSQEGSGARIAERAFCWVMQAVEPLSPGQLVAAVCQDPESQGVDAVNVTINIVLHACKNLVIVDQQLQVCRFSHLSVQEYLETHRIEKLRADCLIAKVCLIFLTDESEQMPHSGQHADNMFIPTEGIRPPNDYDSDFKKYHDVAERSLARYRDQRLNQLHRFVHIQWPVHVRRCEAMETPNQLTPLLIRFLASPDSQTIHYVKWLNIYYFTDTDSSGHAYSRRMGEWPEVKPRDLFSPPTAISAVCRFGLQSVLVQWSVPNPINIAQYKNHGSDLLWLTICGGRADMWEYLIDLGVNVNGDDVDRHRWPLYAASESGNVELITLVLKHGADVHRAQGFSGSALNIAASYGNRDVVQLLLDYGADVNFEGGGYGSPLGAAAWRGHRNVVRLLLDHGANVNLGGGVYGSAFGAAAWSRDQDIVQLLLDHGADVNLGGGDYGSALGAAARGGHRDVVQLLLDHGADVNFGGGGSDSPLGAAAWSGDQDIVQLLLDHGADVNLGGGHFGSALGAAAWHGHRDIVRLLLDHGADVNLRGGDYGSALGAAAREGKRDVAQLLLDHGADANLGGGHFGSALGAAARGGERDVAQLLLENGADYQQKGKYGTPMQVALSQGHQEIAELLKSHIARHKPASFELENSGTKSYEPETTTG